jgi:hypothetical protein
MRNLSQWIGSRAAALTAALTIAGLTAPAAFGYTVTGYVWQFQPGDPAPQRVEWNPVTSPGNVNFISPITFDTNTGGAPAGAQVEVKAAFDRWTVVAGTANLRYRQVSNNAHINIQFVANPAGVPGVTTIGNTSTVFSLDSLLVNRTDRFNLDNPPANTIATDPLDEYDVYTVTIHEVAHDLGLFHLRNSCAVQTAQNFARGIPCSEWVPDPSVEGFPVGTLVYNNPRRVLTPDDIRGIRTLYSQPQADMELERSTFDKFSKRFLYEYRAINRSIAGSDYFLRRIEIPLPEVAAEMFETPTGWLLSPETDATKIVWVADPGNPGIAPGGNFVSGFKFRHPLAPQFGSLTTGFALPDLADVGVGPTGDFDDPAQPTVLDLVHDGLPVIGISFDPLNVPATTEGFVPSFFIADVPTLSEWGMLILTGLFLTSMIYAMVRRYRNVPARGGTHA